jgi:hypothetical protein
MLANPDKVVIIRTSQEWSWQKRKAKTMTKKQILKTVNKEIKDKGYKAISLTWVSTEWIKYDSFLKETVGMSWRNGKLKLQSINGTASMNKSITVESNGSWEIK